MAVAIFTSRILAIAGNDNRSVRTMFNICITISCTHQIRLDVVLRFGRSIVGATQVLTETRCPSLVILPQNGLRCGHATSAGYGWLSILCIWIPTFLCMLPTIVCVTN